MPPSNVLPIHGNEKTMNLNTLLLANIQASPYFKIQLYELKTYHQVIDEIYTRVGHLEPWEKGSRKTAGQTGMCGGVRGVGAGGIVSSCFCLLYKLYTLKLTRKQLIGLCTHTDSPYIRGIGLMYARFTQPPGDLWEWFEPYLDDEEEVDVKAGGGHVMTIGEVALHFLTKLEWYSTLFPRIPVPIEKQIEHNLLARKATRSIAAAAAAARPGAVPERGSRDPSYADGDRTGGSDRRDERIPVRSSRSPDGDTDRHRQRGDVDRAYGNGRADIPRRSPVRDRSRRSSRSAERERGGSHGKRRSPDRERRRSRSADRHSHHSSRRASPDRRDRKRSPERDRRRKSRSRSTDKHSHKRHERSPVRRDRSRSKHRSRSGDRHASRQGSHSRSERRSKDKRTSPKDNDPFERDLQKELERVRKSKSDVDQRNGD